VTDGPIPSTKPKGSVVGSDASAWFRSLIQTRRKTTADQHSTEAEDFTFTPLETRKHTCWLANGVRMLSALGFTLTVELLTETAEASASSDVGINAMLGAEFKSSQHSAGMTPVNRLLERDPT